MKDTPQSRYDRENTIQIKLKLVKSTDADILAYLEGKNKQGEIKRLIRKEIKELS